MRITISEPKHNFTISMDKENILQCLTSHRNSWEPDIYIQAFHMPDDTAPMTKEEYETAYDDMIAMVQHISDENLSEYIKNWPRKKNGTFNRRNVQHLFNCAASEYICEWHNTWIYQQLRIEAINDTELIVTLYQMTDTPG